MGVDAPRTVVATGGRFGLKDSGETPDLLQATYEYPGFIMSYEVCALNAHGAGGRTPEMGPRGPSRKEPPSVSAGPFRRFGRSA
jgi:hypothetical protein